MTIKVAINGYGRIGRNTLRALYESGRRNQIQIVGINDLGDANLNAHLTKYDSTHGAFNGTVKVEGNSMIVNGDEIRITSERDPSKLPWAELGVDVVYECTGIFTTKEKAAAHLAAGAKKVIISAPGTDVDATVVFGVNNNVLKASDTVISNASCTTNCLAPIAKVLNDKFGIVQGSMTTIHAYTNDQVLADVFHKDIYRARSATQSMIPTTTGAAKAVGLVLPELKGKLDGISIRVPTINVSLVDLNVLVEKEVSVEAINAAMKEASEKDMPGVLAFCDEPLVSVDFNHNPHSSNYDSLQTKVYGKWVKVLSWYDNEWGFSNRMLDNTIALMNAK